MRYNIVIILILLLVSFNVRAKDVKFEKAFKQAIHLLEKNENAIKIVMGKKGKYLEDSVFKKLGLYFIDYEGNERINQHDEFKYTIRFILNKSKRVSIVSFIFNCSKSNYIKDMLNRKFINQGVLYWVDNNSATHKHSISITENGKLCTLTYANYLEIQ